MVFDSAPSRTAAYVGPMSNQRRLISISPLTLSPLLPPIPQNKMIDSDNAVDSGLFDRKIHISYRNCGFNRLSQTARDIFNFFK